jgi:gluconolactonase
MKTFVDGLGFPEAPVRLPDGNFLFTEMTPETGCITWVSRDGASRRMIVRTGRPNGLAQDRHGNLWVAETEQRALLKLSLDGTYERFADNCGGEEFLFLNDLTLAPNGDIYLTDSGIAMEELAPGGDLNPDWRDLPYDGRVYRIDPGSGEVERIDNGIRFTNGIAFGPDGNLYVAETLAGASEGLIHRYPWRDGKVVGERTVFANVIDPEGPEGLEGVRGPDGMKFGEDGKLYVAVFGQKNVTVLDPGGEVVRRLPVGGALPTNLVFGADGEKRIYVTEAETGSVYLLDVGTDGYPLNL